MKLYYFILMDLGSRAARYRMAYGGLKCGK